VTLGKVTTQKPTDHQKGAVHMCRLHKRAPHVSNQ
jgi:hypothetical protein